MKMVTFLVFLRFQRICHFNLTDCNSQLHSHIDNYMLHVVESANQTVSISVQTIEQLKYCIPTSIAKLNILEMSVFCFLPFPFNQNWPEQRVAGYSQCYIETW